MKVLTDKTPWPNEQQKIAGVSAFGMSGTNAHLVIEAPPEIASAREEKPTCSYARQSVEPTSDREGAEPPSGDGSYIAALATDTCTNPHLIVVSGKSDESVRQLAGKYARHLGSNPETSIGDTGFTSTCGRSHYEHRGAIVATSSEQAIERLRELERSATGDAVFSGHHRRTPKIAWQFTGQGCLLYTSPSPRDS